MAVVVVSIAVTVTARVLDPTLRSRSAVFGVRVSSSLAMTTVALLSFLVAVSVTSSIPLPTRAV